MTDLHLVTCTDNGYPDLYLGTTGDKIIFATVGDDGTPSEPFAIDRRLAIHLARNILDMTGSEQ